MTLLLKILLSPVKLVYHSALTFVEMSKSFAVIFSGIGKKTLLTISNNKTITNLIVILLSAISPLKNYIHFLVFLLIADALTSVYSQYKDRLKDIERPIKCSFRISAFLYTIDSEKLRRTFEKMIAYILGMIISFFFDKIVLQITPLDNHLAYFSLTNVSVLLICSVEVISVFANLSKITGNPIYKRLIKILNKKVDEKVDSYEKD